MKLYSYEAERHLFDKVQSFAASPARWRMMHIDTNAMYPKPEEKRTQARVLNVMLRDALKDFDLYAYQLLDGDMVLLMEGAVTPIFEAIASKIDGMVPDISGMQQGCLHNDASTFHYYDLSIAFAKAALLADAKLAKYEQLLAMESAAAEEMQPTKPSVLEWDKRTFDKAAAQRALRQNMQVLIIEDDSFTARLVGNVVRSQAEVFEAGSGYIGMAAYVRSAPDMVLLDIELPDTNGHIMLKQILANDPDAFVVMLSGNSQRENVMAALEDGARGFVTKPFAREKIMHYLKLAVAAKKERVFRKHTA